MTRMNDRHSTLRAIRERDPLQETQNAPVVKTFKVGEQATTTKKKLPQISKARPKPDLRNHDDRPPLSDPYERYHIPKTSCASYNISEWVAENEEDPAFNVRNIINVVKFV